MEKTCGNCGNPCGRENCGFWEPNNKVLEQRFQQLAEVARGMITALEVAYIAVDTGREWNSHVIKDYKKRLKELGVEL